MECMHAPPTPAPPPELRVLVCDVMHVKDAHCQVITCTGQQLPIRAPGHPVYGVTVTLQGGQEQGVMGSHVLLGVGTGEQRQVRQGLGGCCGSRGHVCVCCFAPMCEASIMSLVAAEPVLRFGPCCEWRNPVPAVIPSC